MNKLIKLMLLVSSFTLSGCFEGSSSLGGGTPKKASYTLGETFMFDDLELTFKSDFLYERIDNEFSEHDGSKVLGIPVRMTNKKDEPHSLNFMYYTFYGPSGTTLDNESAYFDEATSMDWGGDILPGRTATRYLYCLYDGDGSYSVYLDDFSSKITVTFDFTYNS